MVSGVPSRGGRQDTGLPGPVHLEGGAKAHFHPSEYGGGGICLARRGDSRESGLDLGRLWDLKGRFLLPLSARFSPSFQPDGPLAFSLRRATSRERNPAESLPGVDSEKPGEDRAGSSGRWDLGQSPIQGKSSNFRRRDSKLASQLEETKYPVPPLVEFGITLCLGYGRLGAPGDCWPS